EVLAGASATTDDATAPAVVVRQEVGAGVAVAASLVGKFAALAPARDIAVQRVATPTGVVAEPGLVLAERAGATSPGRPRRPRGTRLRARHIQQRPHREQDRDQPKDSSFHGSFLSVVAHHPAGQHLLSHGAVRCWGMEPAPLKRRREAGSYVVKAARWVADAGGFTSRSGPARRQP